MSEKIIECVPNISEGRDAALIRLVTDQVQTVDGVMLLDVDPGKATNRTVITFVGPPEEVIESAVRLARKTIELIDMRRHTGEHPRFGALDVCPLVPVAGVTMEETAAYARTLAKRLADELGMTIFCYENAATSEQRRNLASVRAGEYEGLRDKLARPQWKPDFGPAEFNAKSGATAVGAREFLIAYNVNLNTTSTRRANAIAFDIREKGRPRRDGDPLTGKIVKDASGETVMIPGSLRCVKAIGWFIEEYGVAQISINLTNTSVTPMHVAFDECCAKAQARGVRVTGSELVGMAPLAALLDAGRYFLRKQQRSTGVSDRELIKIAVKSLGLADLYPFKPDEKVIEYAIEARRSGRGNVGQVSNQSSVGQASCPFCAVVGQVFNLSGVGRASSPPGKPARLIDMTVRDFVEETASESPAPGGGSISAALGAMGAALATMVANLSSHKKGWDARWEEFSSWAEKGKKLYSDLLRLIDEDTDAFNALMAAFGLPNGSDAQKTERKRAIQSATRAAMETPFKVMETALAALDVIKAMAEIGNPNSVSDAGVAALCARSAVMGAFLNVRINASGLDDKAFAGDLIARGTEIERKAQTAESEILKIVSSKIES